MRHTHNALARAEKMAFQRSCDMAAVLHRESSLRPLLRPPKRIEVPIIGGRDEGGSVIATTAPIATGTTY